jgi:citrate synthase
MQGIIYYAYVGNIWGHFAVADLANSDSDGEKGELRYRGVPVETLFHQHDFDTTMYLLIWGRLPTKEEKASFGDQLAKAASPPQQVRDVIGNLP